MVVFSLYGPKAVISNKMGLIINSFLLYENLFGLMFFLSHLKLLVYVPYKNLQTNQGKKWFLNHSGYGADLNENFLSDEYIPIPLHLDIYDVNDSLYLK